MTRNTFFTILITFIIYVCAIYISGQSTVSAGGSAVPAHQHDEHAQPGHKIDDHKVIVSLEIQPLSIQAGDPATLSFSVRDQMGEPVKDLTVMHDRILHVVIISEDLSLFSHIHPEDFGTVSPEMMNSARFNVRYVFPKSGQYLIAVDSAAGGRHFSQQFLVAVTGRPGMGPLKKEFVREKNFGDYVVKLSSSEEHISAGKEITLNYMVSMKGEPVTSLEPYLSAPMHIAVVSSDLRNFIHAHGEVPGSSPGHLHAGHMHTALPDKFGPAVEARIVFPVKGTYQIFGEIKHRNKVVVTSFMVEAE